MYDVTIYNLSGTATNYGVIYFKNLKSHRSLQFVLEMRFLCDKTTHLTRHVKELSSIPVATCSTLPFLLGQVTTLKRKKVDTRTRVQSNKIGRAASLHTSKQPKDLTNVVIRMALIFPWQTNPFVAWD